MYIICVYSLLGCNDFCSIMNSSWSAWRIVCGELMVAVVTVSKICTSVHAVTICTYKIMNLLYIHMIPTYEYIYIIITTYIQYCDNVLWYLCNVAYYV